ncbi:MAG: protein kinase domain-containing protein [Dehalococcoidia bacterium]
MTDPTKPRVLTQVKQYRLVRELGRGGMGAVYEGVDTRDDTRVAVKLLHPWLAAEDGSFRDRFEREAHIAALLRSPYSVRLLDFGVAEGSYYLVMEFVEGSTVGKELEAGPIPPFRALRIAIDTARALEEASARGVVHRDIKPDNILLTPEGRVKVTDFGIARQEGGAGMTAAGSFVGTAAYAAPEQAVGDADHRTDIYALGATLFCMLAGHPPFRGSSVWDVIRQHQSAHLPMEELAHLPDVVTNPIRRCMEKDPRDRYQSASELAGALERALAAALHAQETAGGAMPPAAPPPRPTAAPAPPTRPELPRTQVPEPTTARPEAPTRIAQPDTAPAPPRSPGAPAGAAPVLPQPAGGVRMTAVPTSPAGKIRTFELTVVNLENVAGRFALTATDPTGALAVALPASITLGPAETQRSAVEVRQARTAPASVRSLQFQVVAHRDDGTRAGFVNVTFVLGRQRGGLRSKLPGFAAGAAVAVAIAGVSAFFSLRGGDDPSPGTGSPTAGPAASASANPSAFINVKDRWDYAFRISENTCTFGAKVGDRFTKSFRFRLVQGSGTTIKDGDLVSVVGVEEGGDRPVSGSFTFRVTDFQFHYRVSNTGNTGEASVNTSFSNPDVISAATYTETYDSGKCRIVGQAPT